MINIAVASKGSAPQMRGLNFNIYSQSTWIAGDPNPGTNYLAAQHRSIDYWFAKGARHLRMMFTHEWFQDTLGATIPDGGAAFTNYYNAFVETLEYATGLGMHVMIEHYGYSSVAGDTRPMWKNNLVGGATYTTAHFANLYSQLATTFLDNPRVHFGMLNEPNNMSTMAWFAVAQAVITAIRATGSRAWIFVPGNGYSTWRWTENFYDTAGTQRSSAYGWENANGVGSPLYDPLSRLVATPHIYVDDAGGSSYDIDAVGAGTQANAIVDRIKVVVDWARAYNAAHPTGRIKVYLGEIGYFGAATNDGEGGNYSLATAQACWAAWVAYRIANADILIGYAWWGGSEIGWWGIDATHFGINATVAGTPYSGTTVNMDLIDGFE